jgi:ketosteroid isomerase-like protein
MEPETEALDPQLREELIARERRVWDAIEQQDQAAFLDLVTDDALIVSGGVRRSGAAYAALLPIINTAKVELSEFQVIPAGPETNIVHYTLVLTGAPNRSNLTGQYCVSSVWVRRNDKWMVVFNQDSLAV